MTSKKPPMWLKDGALVWYHPIIGAERAYAGTVDGPPWKLGSGHWVVNLRDMSPEYQAAVRSRSRVNAAYIDALDRRDP